MLYDPIEAPHAFTIRDELIEALGKALYHLEAINDADAETMTAFKECVAVLARAKTVEMP